jgi:hypothetical protein
LDSARLRSLVSRLWSFVFVLALATTARAQWHTTTYTLRGGWNSIYLHGDASHATLEQHFASNPEVVSVWRWNSDPNQAQFGASPVVPTAGTPEWSIWRPSQPTQTTLGNLSGPAAYLIECDGAATTTYNLTITHKVAPPSSNWVRNGANFLGFPTRLFGGTHPTFASYFATFPAAIAANTRIYRYGGGPLGPSNPVQVFSTSAERVERNQAYWFEAPVVGNFYAPLEITPSAPEGLHFGRTGSTFSVRVRNRTAAAVTLTIESLASAPAPVGQESVVGAVPLTRRVFDAATATFAFTPVTAFNEVIGPQATVELVFSLDRALMTGATDAFYASRLRFTDSGNLFDILLPVSARVTSLAGLWVGDIAITDVSSHTLAREHTVEVARTVGATTTIVQSGAVRAGANLLGAATLPFGTGGTLTYQWSRGGQLIAGATTATLTLTPTEAAAAGVFGTTTARPYPLRVLLHVDDTGIVRLLSQVFLGRLASAPHPVGICTTEAALKADDKASATRLVAVHLPLDAVITAGSGSVALGQTLTRTLSVGFNDPTNPFFHTYHPDHDSRNARFQPLSDESESYAFTRTCAFTFAASPPPTASPIGWGSTVLGGTYSETLTGVHKRPIILSGTFELRRISEIGAITTQ